MSDALYERYKEALRRGHVAALRGRDAAALEAYSEAARLAPDRALPLVGHRPASCAASASRPRPWRPTTPPWTAPRPTRPPCAAAPSCSRRGRRPGRARPRRYDRWRPCSTAPDRLPEAAEAARQALEPAESRRAPSDGPRATPTGSRRPATTRPRPTALARAMPRPRCPWSVRRRRPRRPTARAADRPDRRARRPRRAPSRPATPRRRRDARPGGRRLGTVAPDRTGGRDRRLLPRPGRQPRPTRACTWRSPSCTSTAAGGPLAVDKLDLLAQLAELTDDDGDARPGRARSSREPAARRTALTRRRCA